MCGLYFPIVPNGNDIKLTYSNRRDYFTKAIEFRLHELDKQVCITSSTCLTSYYCSLGCCSTGGNGLNCSCPTPISVLIYSNGENGLWFRSTGHTDA